MGYRGKAVLVAQDVEHEVIADLRAYESEGGWYGSLDSGEVDWNALLDRNEELRVRLPNGGEGVVLVTEHDVSSSFAIVDGSGPAPF